MVRELTEKAARFAEVYAGDGVAAARTAGYEGSPKTLSVTASRLMKDSRVREIIAARKAAAGRRASPVETGPAPATSSAVAPVALVDPVRILENIAEDDTALTSARVVAAKELRRAQREEHAAEADPLGAIQAKLPGILNRQRERERDTGCCARCGSPLRRERERDE